MLEEWRVRISGRVKVVEEEEEEEDVVDEDDYKSKKPMKKFHKEFSSRASILAGVRFESSRRLAKHPSLRRRLLRRRAGGLAARRAGRAASSCRYACNGRRIAGGATGAPWLPRCS